MADILLATLLLFGGLIGMLLCVVAGASHPTGRPPAAIYYGMALGVVATGTGLLWWLGLILNWH